MSTTGKPLSSLTADDLMTRDLVLPSEEMPLRGAARLLLQQQSGGASVVDGHGPCVGVLSALDFLRVPKKPPNSDQPATPRLPITCPFQVKHRMSDGREAALCTLPPGVCPIQVRTRDQDGEEWLVCSQPHCVLTDWQMVDLEQLPVDEVHRWMTPDPVAVSPKASIQTLARSMIDARVHRVIVVDEQRRPVGVVSSTDVLAALAYLDGGE